MNRVLWIVGGDTRRLKLAALCQMTLPGPPIVYYGTEVGRSQERDVRSADGSGHPEESRLPMPWGADRDEVLLAFYRGLIALRTRLPGVWRGERRTLRADDETGIYAYACADGTDNAVVVLNNGPVEQALELEQALGGLGVALATDADVRLEGSTVRLPPSGGALLRA
jgi:glycosidase